MNIELNVYQLGAVLLALLVVAVIGVWLDAKELKREEAARKAERDAASR